MTKESEKLLRSLASAIKKLSPEAARLIAAKWELAKAEQDAALAEFLAFLRKP